MRLTALGWRLASAALVLSAAGYVLVYPALVVLGVGILLVLAAALVAICVQPRPEFAREVYPDRVARGDVAVGVMTVCSPAGRRSAWLSASDEYALRGQRRLIPVALPQPVRAGRYDVGYELPTDRRGVATVGPLSGKATDPLGIFQRRLRFGDEHVLRVHPRAHPFALLSALRSMDREGGGAETMLDGAAAFHRLREYVPGDDLRRVHWRSSARMNTLMVRQNVDVTRLDVTVALVTARSSYQDEAMFEEAVEAAASVLVSAGNARVPVRLVTGAGVRCVGRGGAGDIRAHLDELAAAELTEGGGLSQIVDLLRLMPSGGLLVVACGILAAADTGMARQLALRHRPAVIARFGPRPGEASAHHGDRSPPGTVFYESASAAEFCRHWQEQGLGNTTLATVGAR